MKLEFKTRLAILLKNIYVVALLLAIVATLPLQSIDFILSRKNRILKYLESKAFRTLFRINDLRKGF